MDDPLPGSAEELAQAIGRGNAIALLGHVYFSRPVSVRKWRVAFYVPKRIRADHWICEVIGPFASMALAQAFGGSNLQVASCSHLRRAFYKSTAISMHEVGVPKREIAEILGYTERWVSKLIAQHVADGGQIVPRLERMILLVEPSAAGAARYVKAVQRRSDAAGKAGRWD